METTIDGSKYYSIRQAAKLLPWVKCAPTLQKLIIEDMEKNNNAKFKTIVMKRQKQKRYFIKGENLEKLMTLH